MNVKIDIIHDDDNNKYESFYCNICEYPLISENDFTAYTEFKCCNECYLTFAEARKAAWKKGWRPKQNVIDNYVKNRKKLYCKLGEESEF